MCSGICDVKTESNDRCRETRFVLVWCMLFLINLLNMPECGWIMYGPRQVSEYAWSTFHRVLNKPPVLNMVGLRIWQRY